MDEKPHIKNEIKKIPSDPGVYKYFNESGKLIYVGKAKNLKKRVSSYFNKLSGVNLKTRRLVKEVSKIDYIVVNSEFDALLLENNLIKENQPKFNILLKDDKSFPFVCISNDRFPKIYSTRRREKQKGEFYGPYTNVKALNNILDLIRKLYKIRTCNYTLSEENINAGKFKVCLEYHIGNCLGPCENLQSENSYLEEIALARHILKGNLKVVEEYFHSRMKEASSVLNFENAQLFKNKLELLEKFQSKSVIFSKNLHDTDIITVTSADKKAYINYMRIDQGMINISHTVDITKKLDEDDSDLIQLVCIQMRKKFSSHSKLILTNHPFPTIGDDVAIVVPQKGDKKTLIDLSLKNALIRKKDALNKDQEANSKKDRVLKTLQSDLRLKEIPYQIECFDNSNIQGTNPVASMVCFKNGKPSKKDYRHFKIKTVIGPDDFGSMKEVVGRRYKRLKEEGENYPQLIIVDGGKGQLSSACDALKELDLYGVIPIVGIAKRLEEIYYPEDSIPVHISKKSESLKLIQQLRDEAHRFAITFHRQLRSKGQVQSELDTIHGIGESTKNKLLTHYKSFQKIKTAPESELISLIGSYKAKLIQEHIKKGLISK